MKTLVGSTVVTSVWEQSLPDLALLVPCAQPDRVSEIPWLRPNFVDADGALLAVVQSLVVEHGGKQFVVDTCVGDHKDVPVLDAWSHQKTGFLGRFAQAGFDPALVDYVLCTHLHVDHVGWNTYLDNGTWKPTFPNARYLFARTELDHAAAADAEPISESGAGADASETFASRSRRMQIDVYKQSVKPIIDAGLADIVETPCEPLPGLKLVPSPGHTAGHVFVEIESHGEKAVITGDSFHHPCQIAHPEWAAVPDADQNAGNETRRKILREIADTATVLIGSHFAEPVVGHVASDGAAYRFDTD
jgi:glyoxylase-like metal-dependent hydrolase (beta-lactamase superfamily II)